VKAYLKRYIADYTLFHIKPIWL